MNAPSITGYAATIADICTAGDRKEVELFDLYRLQPDAARREAVVFALIGELLRLHAMMRTNV